MTMTPISAIPPIIPPTMAPIGFGVAVGVDVGLELEVEVCEELEVGDVEELEEGDVEEVTDVVVVDFLVIDIVTRAKDAVRRSPSVAAISQLYTVGATPHHLCRPNIAVSISFR